MYTYKTRGTCSTRMDIEVKDGIVTQLTIHDGCKGNLIGLTNLVIGMKTEDVITKLKGIPCQGATSCPDQLALALEEITHSHQIPVTP